MSWLPDTLPDTQSASLTLDSLDPSNPVLSSILDTERGVLILLMVLLSLCRTITTSSDTSCPPDTVSARLILDSADPPSTFPGSTLVSFFLTALDTARGVLTLPMVLPLLFRTITTSSDTSCLLDTVSARLILDSADPPSKCPDYIQATDMEYMVTSTRRSSQC